jgi:large subunit ribosomal protein L26e
VRSLPVRVEDEVRVLRGGFKGKEGKVVQCYRKKYVIHVERCTRDKANGQTINVGIDASNVEITKIKMDKSRKNILDRKNRVKIGQSKGEVPASNVD